jgi:hypothetical protein
MAAWLARRDMPEPTLIAIRDELMAYLPKTCTRYHSYCDERHICRLQHRSQHHPISSSLSICAATSFGHGTGSNAAVLRMLGGYAFCVRAPRMRCDPASHSLLSVGQDEMRSYLTQRYGVGTQLQRAKQLVCSEDP